jgi:shikimate kinase
MGAGKSAVGLAVARRLGWRHADVDDEVEKVEGTSVREIFSSRGEEGFRGLEARVADELLAAPRVVISTGGGWAAVPERLAGVPPGTVSIWLDVSPEEALRRVQREPGRRPLLDVEHPLETARALMARRRSAYAAADRRVDTDASSVDDVTARVLAILAELGLESSTE